MPRTKKHIPTMIENYFNKINLPYSMEFRKDIIKKLFKK